MAKKDYMVDGTPVQAAAATKVVDVMSGVNYPVVVKYNGEEYVLSPATGLKNVYESKLVKPLPTGVYLVPKN